MNRTKTLIKIVSILLFFIAVALFYVNFDETLYNINELVELFSSKKIVVPEKNQYARTYNYKTISETDNFKPTNIDDIRKIYYTVLNRGWDSFTFYCPKEYTNCINDVKKIGDDSEFISLINNYVSPYNSYKKYNTLINGKDELYLTVEKLYSEIEVLTVDNIILKEIDKLGINKNNVTITDIKNIHNYIINKITYDEKYTKEDIYTVSNKAYGALMNNTALCSGYTDTFALFLDKLNVPNFKVTSEDHVWNVIYFNNKWRHIDVTWDDDEVNKNNTYNFFMITTKDLLSKDSEEHNFNQSLYLELN